MSASIMEAQLFGLLCRDGNFATRGYSVRQERKGGIAILRRGCHQGFWTWQRTGFAFTAGDGGAPNFKAVTAVEALLHTRNVICPGHT